jgi:hypothetical protein
VTFASQAWKVKKRCWAVAVADLNRDGALDVASLSAGKPWILYSNGDLTFRKAVRAPGGTDPYTLVVDDFNRDRWPDLAVLGTKGVAIVSGSPDGRMIRASPISLRYPFMGITSGDIDADTLPDLVVGRIRMWGGPYDVEHTEYRVVAYRGLGDGTFTELAQYDAKKYPSALALADLDRDGWLDLAVSDRAEEGAVMIRRGLGGGAFSEARGYPTPRPTSFAVADLDGNGWPDIALASDGEDKVGVLYGGPGGFAPVIIYPIDQLQGCIACADFDGDLRLDLVVTTGTRTGTALLLYGQPGGGFGQATSYPVGPDPRGVAAGDFDSDGRPDIVATSYASTTLVVLHNLGAGP